MIFDTIANADRYATLHPLFAQAFAYIRNTDLNALAPGRYPIADEDLFAIVEHVPGRSRESARTRMPPQIHRYPSGVGRRR